MDQEEEFIRHSKGIAKTFVDLYLMKEFKKSGTVIPRSPEERGGVQKKAIVPLSEEDISAEADNQITLEVSIFEPTLNLHCPYSLSL